MNPPPAPEAGPGTEVLPEQDYRALVEGAGDLIFSSTQEGRLTVLNTACRQALGYDEATAARLRLHDIVVGEYVEKLSELAAVPVAADEALTVELELLHRTGRHIRAVASCHARGNGRHTPGVDVIARPARRREQDTPSPEAMLKALLENSGDYIYFFNEKCQIVNYSKSFHSKQGIPECDSLIGLTDFDLYTPDHAQPAQDDEMEIMRTGRPVLDKLEKETNLDGTITWALTSKHPWYDEDGRLIGVFGISKNVTKLKQAEAKLEQLHSQLVLASRTAGMAEVANDVLHNVGNVLNSVNVSCSMALDRVTESRLAGLAKLADLLEEHAGDLGEFISNSPAGKQIPKYVAQLRDREAEDRQFLLGELQQLREKIDHIKQIVSMQQDYAKVAGAYDKVPVTHLVEDALQINAAALDRHKVTVVRDYAEDAPEITTDKHKVLQILVNIIRNAKYAMDESDMEERIMTVRVRPKDLREVEIVIQDNGCGISKENLARIFTHGFTTRKNGHGFGLHSGSTTAKELGGSLVGYSDGPGEGARFTLLLPLESKKGVAL